MSHTIVQLPLDGRPDAEASCPQASWPLKGGSWPEAIAGCSGLRATSNSYNLREDVASIREPGWDSGRVEPTNQPSGVT